MKEGLAEKVLFEGEADEYASIIENNPISHDDCIEILKVVAKQKGLGYSNKTLIERLTRKKAIDEIKGYLREEIKRQESNFGYDDHSGRVEIILDKVFEIERKYNQ